MVRHEHAERKYGTLPGGGVEPGENMEQAVIREVLEETQLHIKVAPFLFEEPYTKGTTYCDGVTANKLAEAKLGSDSEEPELPFQDRKLPEVAWPSLESMKNDRQVSKVLEWLSKNGKQVA